MTSFLIALRDVKRNREIQFIFHKSILKITIGIQIFYIFIYTENFEIGQNVQNIKKDTARDEGKFKTQMVQFFLENKIERNARTSKYLCYTEE